MPHVKLSMVIMSHLSDMQEEFIHSKKETNKINFIKWLILKYSPKINLTNVAPTEEVITLSSDIDADKDWAEFTASRFYKP